MFFLIVPPPPHTYILLAQGQIIGYSLSSVTSCRSAGRNLSCYEVSLPLPGLPQLLYRVIELERAYSRSLGEELL